MAVRVESQGGVLRRHRSATSYGPGRTPEVARWGQTPPSEYKRTYGELPKVTASTGIGMLFGNGVGSHQSPLIVRRPVEFWPGANSFMPESLRFLEEFTDTCNREVPSEMDADGYTTNGVVGNFDKMRTIAGYYATPISYTLVDNTSYRKSLGLRAGYSAEERTIAENVWRIVFSSLKLAPVNVPKKSTGGFRRFTTSAQWKLDFAAFLFENLDQFLDAVWKEDWVTLANEFECVLATYIQKRGQIDVASKQRISFDLLYALTGGKEGKADPTDKRVYIDGVEYPAFSALRARVIHAGPWVVNCLLQCLFTPMLASLFSRFPKVFHVAGGKDLTDLIDGHHIACSDVSEYDRSMSFDAIKTCHTVMAEFVDPRFVKLSWRLCTAPYYAKPLGLDAGVWAREGKEQVAEGFGATWVGDPRDWTCEVFAGNRSGHAGTSAIAKVNKFIDNLFIINRIVSVVGKELSYMEAQPDLRIKVINNGDDGVIYGKDKADIDRYNELQEVNLKNPSLTVAHYKAEPELGFGYSGQYIMFRDKERLLYKTAPRVQTPAEKTFVPERAIGGVMREFWAIGVSERIKTLHSTDAGRAVLDVLIHSFNKHLGRISGDFSTTLSTELQKARTLVDLGANPIDTEVFLDPDKLAYKYSASEVSDHVLELTTSKIPESAVLGVLRKIYKGNIDLELSHG